VVVVVGDGAVDNVDSIVCPSPVTALFLVAVVVTDDAAGSGNHVVLTGVVASVVTLFLERVGGAGG
jgi:hypothetical protein